MTLTRRFLRVSSAATTKPHGKPLGRMLERAVGPTPRGVAEVTAAKPSEGSGRVFACHGDAALEATACSAVWHP